MKKRILSIFTALALCLSLLPGAALAAEIEVEPDDGPIVFSADPAENNLTQLTMPEGRIKPAEGVTVTDDDEDGKATVYISIGNADDEEATAEDEVVPEFTLPAPTGGSYWTVTIEVPAVEPEEPDPVEPGEPESSAEPVALDEGLEDPETVTYTIVSVDGLTIAKGESYSISAEDFTALKSVSNAGSLTVSGTVTADLDIKEGTWIFGAVDGDVIISDDADVTAESISGTISGSGNVTIGENKFELDKAEMTYGEVEGKDTLSLTEGIVKNDNATKDEGNSDAVLPVTYNIVIKAGTFNTNGVNVTGTVTFDNDLQKDEETKYGASVPANTIPTITDGGTDNYGSANNSAAFLKNVTFTAGAAGYIKGRMHAQSSLTTNIESIKLDDGAYAAIAYGRLESKYTALGNGVTINMTGELKSGVADAAKIDAAVVKAVEEGHSANFYFNTASNNAANYGVTNGGIDVAKNAVVTLNYYGGAATVNHDITVGDGATLNIIGAASDKVVTIEDKAADAGKDNAIKGTTTVCEGATLNLENVKHERETNPNILTETGATVNLTDSTYTGKPNENATFNTNHEAEPETFGIPEVVELSFDGAALDTETPTAVNVKVGTDDNAVTYTSAAYEVTEEDAVTKDGIKVKTYSVYLKADTGVDDGGFTVNPFCIGSLVLTSDGTAVLTAQPDFSARMTVNGDKSVKTAPARSLFGAESVPTITTATIEKLTETDVVAVNFTQTERTEDKPGTDTAVIEYTGKTDTAGDPTLTVKLNSTPAAAYKADFIVRANTSMTIYLMGQASIAAGSTFKLETGASLTIIGEGSVNAVKAPINVAANGVTVTLKDVTLTSDNKDNAAFSVAGNVQSNTLKIEGTVAINGAAGADSTEQSHSKSAGIKNQGGLTIDVDAKAQLKVNGAAGAEIKDSSKKTSPNLGGAGIWNSGALTFTGSGVAVVTGGTGGKGYSYTTAAENPQTSGIGGAGAVGGAGLYNTDSVTVATDSATWTEGQVVIIGGKGGDGGQGQKNSVKATHGTVTHTAPSTEGGTPTHSYSDWTTSTGAKGGDGGDSGIGVNNSTVGALIVESGVFLNYSGTIGQPGTSNMGTPPDENLNCAEDGCNWSCKSQHIAGDPGTAGKDDKYAISGGTLTINGGTTYAFGGASNHGGNLDNTYVNGGNVYGGQKDSTGYTRIPHASGTDTQMVPTDGLSGFGSEFHGGIFVRIKTGTEGAKFHVESMTIQSKTGDGAWTPVKYTATRDMYVNEQGFLYLYLPLGTEDGAGSGDTKAALAAEDTTYLKAELVLSEDVKENARWYSVTCGGKTGDSLTVQDYGYGSLGGSGKSSSADSSINYDGSARWGEAFEFGGVTYHNGIDMETVNEIIDDTKTEIATGEDLAALAYVVNVEKNDCAGKTFTVAANIDVSRFAWTPIGTAETPFRGTVTAETTATVKGVRMPADCEGAFGLFGYTDGADITHLTLDGGAVAGHVYEKHLQTNVPQNPFDVETGGYFEPKDDNGAPKISGGQYKWTAADMKWESATTAFVGAFIGSAKNTRLAYCKSTDLQINAGGTVGGLVGNADNSNIIACVVGKKDVNVALIGDAVGGLVGKMTGGVIAQTYIRDVTVGSKPNSSWCDLIHTADGIKMITCYASNTGSMGSSIAYLNNSIIVATYSGNSANNRDYFANNDRNGTRNTYYNVYYQVSGDFNLDGDASDDTLVKLDADALKTASSALNNKIADSDNEWYQTVMNANNSEGILLGYKDTTSENNDYPIYGEYVKLTLTVTNPWLMEGLTVTSGTSPNVVTYPVAGDAFSNNGDRVLTYWVPENTQLNVEIVAVDGLAKAKIGENGSETTPTDKKVTGTINGLTVDSTTPITLTAKTGEGAPKQPTYTLTGDTKDAMGAEVTNDGRIYSIMLSVPSGVTVDNLEQFDGTATAVFPNGYRVSFGTPITADEANTYFKDLSVSADKNGDYTVGVAILGVPNYVGPFPTELKNSVGAVGSFTFTKQSTGGNGGGTTGGGTTGGTGNTGSGVADPDKTGVSGWLITDDHIAYMHGYDIGIFGPNDNMTRAQAAQMFYNLLRNKNVPVTASFTDVPDGAWFEQAVNVIASMGIMNGIGGGEFAPHKAITRAEFTAAAMHFAKLPANSKNIFSDVKPGDWFYDQVIGAVKYGWINGFPDGTFRPNAPIGRAEVAAIVNDMLGRSADKAFVDSHEDKLILFPDMLKRYWSYYDVVEATNAHDHTGKSTERWTGLN